MIRPILACLALLGSLSPAGAQLYDVNGDPIGPFPHIVVDTPGSVLQSITTSNRVVGTAPDGDTIWTCPSTSPIQVFQYDAMGNLLNSVQTSVTSGYGMGFDSSRSEFVIAGPSTSQVVRVDLTGSITATFPSPTTRPIGAAYDSNRDAYWVPDWSANVLHLMDALTGATIQASFSLTPSGCTRAADIGYDPVNDLLAIVGRDGNQIYLFRAGNPPTFLQTIAFGFNPPGNPRGAAISTRGHTFWSTAFSANLLLEYDLGLPRVQAPTNVRVGTMAPLNFIATNAPGKNYQAAASFTEGVVGIPFGTRYFPLAVDNLFGLSVTVPQIFGNMRGVLNAQGLAAGQVAVPNIGALAGQKFSVAFVTADVSAPQGILDISGPLQMTIQP